MLKIWFVSNLFISLFYKIIEGKAGELKVDFLIILSKRRDGTLDRKNGYKDIKLFLS